MLKRICIASLFAVSLLLILTNCENPSSDPEGVSENANLSSLIVNAGTLTPSFTPALTAYTVNVANSVSTIQATATAADKGASIEISPAQPMALTEGGDNLITVTVTSAKKTVKTYTVAVTRASASESNADLATLTLSKGSLSVPFDPAIQNYTASVANAVSTLTVSATPADEGATVSIQPAQPTSLSVGQNTITVTVTSQNNTVKPYTIVVTRREPVVPVDLTGHKVIAGESGGLKILDISNPEIPTLRSSCATGSPSRAKAVAISGNHAYVCDYASGLVVIDISNLSAPTEVATYSTNLNQAYDIAIKDDYAYIARDYFNTITILNISDPEHPTFVKTVSPDTPSIQSIALAGDSLYLTNNKGLMILSLEEPETPAVSGNCETTRTASMVKVVGDYAYVATSQQGLVVIDISDPTSPFIAGELALGSSFSESVSAIDINGTHAFVTGYNIPFSIVDISTPSSPALLSQYEGTSSGKAILSVEDYVYFITSMDTVEIIDVSNPAAPRSFRRNPEIDGVRAAISGDYAFVTEGSKGMSVIDISSPDYPEKIEEVDTTLEANCITIAGTTAFVSSNSYSTTNRFIDIFDISNPESPIKTDTISTYNDVKELAVGGNLLFICEYQKFSIYNLATEAFVTHSLGLSTPYGVTVNGKYAYIADGLNGLVIADVSNPTAISRSGSVSVGGSAQNVSIHGNYAYVVVSDVGVAVVDVSDPVNPTLVTTNTSTTSPRKSIVSGSTLWVCEHQYGLFAHDLSNPANPVLLGEHTLPVNSMINDFAINGTRAFVFDVTYNMVTVDITTPSDMYNMEEIFGNY